MKKYKETENLTYSYRQINYVWDRYSIDYAAIVVNYPFASKLS